MDLVEGEDVTPETLIHEDATVDEVDDAEELLVEEVSIDGLCGVY
jgi:mycofactocin precursor